MTKVATSITNFHYASKLKSMGFKTGVHALPQDGRDMVDSLLFRGANCMEIANQIQQQYGKYIEGLDLKPVSDTSVRTYRDNYWIKGEGVASIVEASPIVKTLLEEARYKAEEMLNEYDGLKKMIKFAKMEEELIDKPGKLEENPMGMIDSNRDTARFRSFQMAKQIHDTYVNLGIVKTLPPPPIKIETTIDNSDDGDNEDFVKMLDELNKFAKKEGIYGKQNTGERIGMNNKIIQT